MAVLGVAALALGSCETSRPTTPEPSPTPAPTPAPTPTPNPAPQPEATPASCPVLTRWSSGIHNITDALSHPISFPIVGGHVVIDSTPLFQGRACNAEHDHCGGRKCEDPRGGEWTLLEGTSPSQNRGDGFQFRIGPLSPGLHRWRVCPYRDAMDAEGQPVIVDWGRNPCSEGIFVATDTPPQQ